MPWQKTKMKKKNREIFWITISFVGIFLLMTGYFICYGMTHKEELLDNSYNNRQQLLTAENCRGRILSEQGEVLAKTQTDQNGKETRVYPYDNLFAHAVGYTDKGKTGLEKQANYYLIQSDIPETKKVKNEILGEKNPGNDLYTTLDVTLQQAASKAMGIYKGAIIAMEPKTGKILAMVSKPDFNPGTIASEWDDMLAQEESGILVNRVTQGLYPPGSTFKIMTTLEFIRENPDTYLQYHFDCTGSFQYGEDKISCYHHKKHGTEDLKKSFAKSCNSSFANIGIGLDREKFAKTLSSMYFNQKLPYDGICQQSKITLNENVIDSDMLQIAIGQGKTQITPLHLAMITSAVANDGILMKPYMMERIENNDQTVIKEYQPETCGQLMTPEESEVLREFMEAVVEEGTAGKLSGLSYTAAGKTGSAEYNREKGESHAWFTGYTPAENPQLVVTVIVEGAGSGGDYAVPLAKRVFDAWYGENE